MPISYSKVQGEIKKILNKIDSSEDQEIGFANEKQKRLYKHELLQESYQNKMGLINKPSMNQLMICDFIRERSLKATKFNGKELDPALEASANELYNNYANRFELESKIKANTSDSNLFYSKQHSILPKYFETKLRRRYTSKNAEKVQGGKGNESTLTEGRSESKLRRNANKSKSKGAISKIKLRNPSNLKCKFSAEHVFSEPRNQRGHVHEADEDQNVQAGEEQVAGGVLLGLQPQRCPSGAEK